MILVRWLAAPGARSPLRHRYHSRGHARCRPTRGWSLHSGGVTLDPRIDLLVRQLAAELSGALCIEHGLIGGARRFSRSPSSGRCDATPRPALLRRAARSLAFTKPCPATRRAGGMPTPCSGAAEHFSGRRSRTHPGRAASILQSATVPRATRACDAGRAGRPASCGLGMRTSGDWRKRPVLESPGGRWLLLIHQLPPSRLFRVKIWRRLQRSARCDQELVYVLPQPSKPAKTFNGCGAKSWPEAASIRVPGRVVDGL